MHTLSELRELARFRAVHEKLNMLMYLFSRQQRQPLPPPELPLSWTPEQQRIADTDTILVEEIRYEMPRIAITKAVPVVVSPPITDPNLKHVEEVSMCEHTDKTTQLQEALLARMRSEISTYFNNHDEQLPAKVKIGATNNLLISTLLRAGKYFPETNVIVEAIPGYEDRIECCDD